MFVYLDDILIASCSMEEHLIHVEQVLERLEGAGLRLKPEKCKFATNQVEYLGHTLTTDGVKPNEAKIVAVKEFPKPHLAGGMDFLGLSQFLQKARPKHGYYL